MMNMSRLKEIWAKSPLKKYDPFEVVVGTVIVILIAIVKLYPILTDSTDGNVSPSDQKEIVIETPSWERIASLDKTELRDMSRDFEYFVFCWGAGHRDEAWLRYDEIFNFDNMLTNDLFKLETNGFQAYWNPRALNELKKVLERLDKREICKCEPDFPKCLGFPVDDLVESFRKALENRIAIHQHIDKHVKAQRLARRIEAITQHDYSRDQMEDVKRQMPLEDISKWKDLEFLRAELRKDLEAARRLEPVYKQHEQRLLDFVQAMKDELIDRSEKAKAAQLKEEKAKRNRKPHNWVFGYALLLMTFMSWFGACMKTHSYENQSYGREPILVAVEASDLSAICAIANGLFFVCLFFKSVLSWYSPFVIFLLTLVTTIPLEAIHKMLTERSMLMSIVFKIVSAIGFFFVAYYMIRLVFFY